MDITRILSDLHRQGYHQDAHCLCGFSLSDHHGQLKPERMVASLQTSWLGKQACFFHEVTSTNDILAAMAEQGAPHGTIVVSDHQTAGRGRSGRSWESPAGTGLLFSILMTPDLDAELISLITLAAAVGTAKAIYAETRLKVGIKWPNDIIIEGRKMCGILTESRFQNGKPQYVIVGIGINIDVAAPQWQEEIRDSAVSIAQLTGASCSRQRLLIRVCEENEKMMDLLFSGDSDAVIREWGKWTATLGKEVKVHMPGDSFHGRACAVTPNGGLVIETEDGGTRTIHMGEISIRHEV